MHHRAPVHAWTDMKDIPARIGKPDPGRAALGSGALQLRVMIELAAPIVGLEGADTVGDPDRAIVGGREVRSLDPIRNRGRLHRELCVFLVIGEQLLEHAARIGKKLLGHRVVLGVLVAHLGEAAVVQ